MDRTYNYVIIKRLFDILLSSIGFIIFMPILIIFCILIWLNDHHSPFYISKRVGENGKIFKIIKLRSMMFGAHELCIDNTSSDDYRVTKIGRILRKYKIDEIPQFINVLKGDMHLVGPRPDVPRSVNLYTEVEKGMLSVKPGITDIASIVFSDAEHILKGSKNLDLDYNKLIRPWKSRLGLIYISNKSIILDIYLICLTILLFFSRQFVLKKIDILLERFGVSFEIRQIILRQKKLKPFPPPGTSEIVNSY